MRYFFSLLIFLTVSCSGLPVHRVGLVQMEAKCMEQFKKIEEVQGERDKATNRMGKVTEMYEYGVISKQEHRHQRVKWLIKENSLRTIVNDLYREAQKMNCL